MPGLFIVVVDRATCAGCCTKKFLKISSAVYQLNVLCGRDKLAKYFCVYFDLMAAYVYRTVQLIQHKGTEEMHLIDFVNFALLLYS